MDGVLAERHDGAWLAGTPERHLLVEQPQTFEERLALARQCEAEMKLGFPFVVDGMDDAVDRAWAGWPDRLYVVDRDGLVVYRGGKGPMGFRPDELEAVLAEMAEFYGR